HRGIVVISDRRLAGRTAQRRSYRRVFLESLDPGLQVPDEVTGEPSGGNVLTMAEGWRTIWQFLGENGLIERHRAAELCEPDALRTHTLLPATREILDAVINPVEEAAARAAGKLGDLLVERCGRVAGLLRFSEEPFR